MAAVQDVVDVDVPITVAYDQWTQFESFPEFMSGVEEVRQLDDDHLHWKIKIAGVSREYDAEITEQRPDEIVAWHATGDTDNSGTISFMKLGDARTRVTAVVDYATDGLVEKVGDALDVPQRQLRSDLDRFKAFIESRGGETGEWRGEVE